MIPKRFFLYLAFAGGFMLVFFFFRKMIILLKMDLKILRASLSYKSGKHSVQDQVDFKKVVST